MKGKDKGGEENIMPSPAKNPAGAHVLSAIVMNGGLSIYRGGGL